MSRDRVIGGGMFIAAIVIWILYTIYGFLLLVFPGLKEIFPMPIENLMAIPLLVIWLGVTGVLFIVAWIGWTLATTPPPKPIEEIEKEIEEELKKLEEETKAREKEEKEEKGEEKSE